MFRAVGEEKTPERTIDYGCGCPTWARGVHPILSLAALFDGDGLALIVARAGERAGRRDGGWQRCAAPASRGNHLRQNGCCLGVARDGDSLLRTEVGRKDKTERGETKGPGRSHAAS